MSPLARPFGTAVGAAPITTGTVGTAGTASRSDHAHPTSFIGPQDVDAIAWTSDPQECATTLTLTSGTMYLARMKLVETSAIATVAVPISTGGAGTTSSYVVIYATDGTQLGVSADLGTSWASSGTKFANLATPTAVQVAGTIVIAGILAVGGGPTIRAKSTAPSVNHGLQRYAALGSLTTPPSPLAGQSGITTPFLILLS